MMRINEVAEQLGLSQRALKYYEKEGLLEVRRDENGYRNYSAQDLERLKKISLYRKLGIAIKDTTSRPPSQPRGRREEENAYSSTERV